MALAWVMTLALAVGQEPVSVPTASPRPAAVELDAVAVDSRGRRVADLHAGDVTLTEAGVPRSIDSVRYVAGEPRLFGFFLDEYHVAPGDAADRLRRALREFVERLFQPGDRAIVVKPLDSLITLPIVDSKDEVLRSVAAFEGRKGVYEPRDGFERQFMAGDATRIERTRVQIATSALNALATQLAAAGSGRKAMIVVSEGFVGRARNRGEELLPTVETLIRTANRGSVAIYPVHPRALGAAGADEPSIATLKLLADETGGDLLAEPAASGQVFEPLARDTAGYYVIAFQPAARDGASRFHPVELRVKRKDVRLRARKGYWTPLPADIARARTEREEAAAARVPELPRRTSPLIRPWFGMARGDAGQTRVRFVWQPAARPPGDRTRSMPPATITLKALTADGQPVFEGTVAEGAAAAFDARPGRLRVQMTIADASARVLDTDVRDVAIVPLGAPVVLGSFEVFRARNALEFRTLATSAAAVPTPVREFSRMERLLVRVPVYAPEPTPSIAAALVSRLGSRLRDLEVSPGPDGRWQIDLPLAAFAAGEYRMEIAVSSPAGSARDALIFRVTP